MAELSLPESVRRIGHRVLVAGTGVTALFTTPAAAQTGGSESSCGSMPEQFQDIAELLTRIQELGVALALLIASIMLIYGGGALDAFDP